MYNTYINWFSMYRLIKLMNVLNVKNLDLDLLKTGSTCLTNM